MYTWHSFFALSRVPAFILGFVLLILVPGIALANISTVTSDSKAFTYAQDGTPFETQFSSDGTKMYMLGMDNDRVYQYTLSTPWDVSTASYDSVSFSVTSQESNPEGLFFKPDGSAMYVVGIVGDRAYQYTLSTPWDLSTASYASKSSPSNSANDPTTVKVWFNSDGTKMFLLGFVYGRVYSHTLSTPWDVSTAVYDNVYFSTAAQTTNPYAFAFNSTGTKMFAVSPSDVIYQYTLGTAWTISTASYESLSFNANSVDTNLYGITLKSDDTKIYFTGATNNRIYQYSITLADTTAPTVQSLGPVDNDTNVSPLTSFVMIFTEAVDVETGNITIKKTSDNSTVETIDVTSGLVTGTGTTMIGINPSVNLADLTQYYVLVDATAFDDAAGNSFAGISSTTAWNFTTGDITSPSISTLSPADGETGVLSTANLVMTFTEAVDVETGNILIKKVADDTTVETIDVTSGLVTGTGTTTITINPSTTLTAGVAYYIQVATTAFDDVWSNSYAGITDTSTWNFTILRQSSGSDISNVPLVTDISIVGDTFNPACAGAGSGVLTLRATNADAYLISNNAFFVGAQWVDFVGDSLTIPWIFNVAQGDAIVYALFKNSVGSFSDPQVVALDLGEAKCGDNNEDVSEEVGESDDEVVQVDEDEGVGQEELFGPSPWDGTLEHIDSVVGMSLIRGTNFNTVYLLENGKRRSFMNEALYFTWFEDFSAVHTVTDATLATIAVGSPVLPKPGSLVKISSIPDVYLVAESEVSPTLRRIASEEDARTDFGDNWAKEVIDVDIILFMKFLVGDWI